MQPVKLITMLGTGNYQTIDYRLDTGHEAVKTSYFPVAVVRWFRPTEVFVLLTELASQHKNWLDCRATLREQMPSTVIREISIPDGKNEQELWQIFSSVADAISEGDSVIVDVTHGFRSLPMLTLLAVAYLRQVKSVKVERILYGAFEAKDEHDVAPVFDLTPFVELFDWLTAAKIFTETGDGRELATLMRDAQAEAHKAKRPDPPRMLIPASEKIKQVSENLLTNRVPAIAPAVRELEECLGQSQTLSEISHWLPPLAPLLGRVSHAYMPFAEGSLHDQAQLIKWYAEHGHTIHALTCAREWLINYELERAGGDPMDYKRRDEIGKQINERADKGEQSLVAEAWRLLSGVRNDIAHCGFRHGFANAQTLRQTAEKAHQTIDQILRSQTDGQ